MTAHPFVKMVGGKTFLLPEILARLPTKISTYYEPFVGGGAVFFELANRMRFKRAVIGDANEELMNLYSVIRKSPYDLMAFLDDGFGQDEKSYYKIRAQDPKALGHLGRAARTLYLNKTCFTPGAQVLMENETWRAIEEMACGDRLWNGRVVSEVLSRPYYGTVRRIRVRGSPWTLSVTEDHPILTAGKCSGRQERRTLRQIWYEAELQEARELQPGDYVFLPTIGVRNDPIDWHKFWPSISLFGPQTNKRRLTKNPRDTDVARLLGYYAAEGHIMYQSNRKDGSRGRISAAILTFHKNERKTYIADLEGICRRLFNMRPRVVLGTGGQRNQYSVRLHSVQIATFIKTLVPGLSWARRAEERKSKRLHSALMTLAPETQLELLKGWIRGDGGLRHKQDRNTSELTGTCTVLPLAHQMYRLAQRCGLKPSWRISVPKGRTHHQDGSVVDNTAANISFSGDDVQTLGFKILPRKRKSCDQRRFIGGYLCVRVKDISDLHYDGAVYNIEVDGDRLICVDGVISHNCFNGLHRVNRKGVFNVPWGRQEGRALFDEENLLACCDALSRSVTLTSLDFETTVLPAKKGDVVYADCPYFPLSDTSNFTAYEKGGFGLEEQTRLRDVAKKLVERGVHVLLSNSDTPAVRKLYRGFKIEEVQAPRRVNSKGGKRGNVGELLISGRNTK